MRARILALLAVLVTVFVVYGYERSTAAEGRPAPGFSLADASGRVLSLQSLRGRVVLLEFWASWCTVCRLDTPAVRTFAERYADRVAVVGVDWREPTSALRQWVGAYGLAFPNLRDGSGAVARKYGLTGVPEAWWIAPDGTARLHVVGPVDFEQLQSQYQQVAHTALDPAALPTPEALAVAGGRLWLATEGDPGGLWTAPISAPTTWTRVDLPGAFQAVAAADGYVMAAGAQAGWVASDDGGAHWAAVRAAGAGGRAPTALAADAAQPGVFYAWAGGRLLHASTWRGGFSALPVQPSLTPGDTVAAVAGRGPALLVATAAGVLVSSDGGAHWRASGLQRPPLGSQEFTTATAALEGFVPLVASAAQIGADDAAYLAGPDGIYAAPKGGAGSGDRLALGPARAIAALAQADDGVLWAIAPDGDLYTGTTTGAWRLVGTFSGQAVGG